MTKLPAYFVFVIVTALLLLLCGFASSPAVSISTSVVVTAAPVYDALAALHGRERFPQGSQLLRIDKGEAAPLVSGFYATADADISFDATHILFAGKQTAASSWRIWELTLSDHQVREVISSPSDAIRPLYLPGNRLVYAQRESAGFRMNAATMDGSNVLPLTYFRGSALPSRVLLDGRILFESGYPLGSGDTPELYLVYSDGSGIESYRCDHGTARWGGTQLASGDVVFTHGATLARFTSPLASEAAIEAPRASYAGAIAETPSGAWIVSSKADIASHYQLTLWQPGSLVTRPILAQGGQDLVDPVLLSARTVPNRHPSALHDWTTANLLALDARQSREGALGQTPISIRVETQDSIGNVVMLGQAPVEPDGSFFVKAPGNQPIRFSLLDAQGNVLRQEHGWFWSRGGEQRICVGCHTGPERAPDNRVPAVLLRTTEPADVSGSKPAPVTGGN